MQRILHYQSFLPGSKTAHSYLSTRESVLLKHALYAGAEQEAEQAGVALDEYIEKPYMNTLLEIADRESPDWVGMRNIVDHIHRLRGLPHRDLKVSMELDIDLVNRLFDGIRLIPAGKHEDRKFACDLSLWLRGAVPVGCDIQTIPHIRLEAACGDSDNDLPVITAHFYNEYITAVKSTGESVGRCTVGLRLNARPLLYEGALTNQSIVNNLIY